MISADLATDRPSFNYFAFGLRISANREVPGLMPCGLPYPPDLTVWLGSVPAEFRTANGSASDPASEGMTPDQASQSWVTIWKYENFYRVRYTDSTEFFVERSGGAVWATWPNELTVADTATYLLGPVMNIVLRLRGVFALHASVVRIGGAAVAFVGPEGAGKSTTAAAFALAGYAVLTDDIAAIDDGGTCFDIMPAYPRVRLWPNSVQLLFGSGEALPRLTPGWEKRYLQLEGARPFQAEAVRLASIYFLHPRNCETAAPAIEPEPEREAMVKLIGNIGANYILDQEDCARSFDLLQRLARFIPLRRLIPGFGTASLPRLCEAVVNDLETLQKLPT